MDINTLKVMNKMRDARLQGESVRNRSLQFRKERRLINDPYLILSFPIERFN